MSFTWVSPPCDLPVGTEVPFRLRLGPSDLAWVAVSQVCQFSILSPDRPWTCSVVLFPVLSQDLAPSASPWAPWMDPGLSSSPHPELALSEDSVSSTCPCSRCSECCGTASDHEKMAWALVTLHSWLIPVYGAAPLLLLPDRINLSMGYSGKSRHVILQVKPLPTRGTKQVVQCLAYNKIW